MTCRNTFSLDIRLDLQASASTYQGLFREFLNLRPFPSAHLA